MSKVYVLQKDIVMPARTIKAGTEYGYYNTKSYVAILKNDTPHYQTASNIENNPEWFLPKEFKIEVSGLFFDKETDWWGRKDCTYTIATRQRIPPEKYEAVKKAIEFVLNDDRKEKFESMLGKLSDEKEVLQKEQDAFEAARKGYPLYDSTRYYYFDFNAYKNSQK